MTKFKPQILHLAGVKTGLLLFSNTKKTKDTNSGEQRNTKAARLHVIEVTKFYI